MKAEWFRRGERVCAPGLRAITECGPAATLAPAGWLMHPRYSPAPCTTTHNRVTREPVAAKPWAVPCSWCWCVERLLSQGPTSRYSYAPHPEPCTPAVSSRPCCLLLSARCREARDHGVGHVGLPSRLATFNLTRTPASSKSASNSSPSWWQQESKTQQQQKAKSDAHSDSNSSSGSSSGDVEVLEVWNAEPSGRGRGLRSVPVVRLELPRVNTATGPRITLTLPSFRWATPRGARGNAWLCRRESAQRGYALWPAYSVRPLHLRTCSWSVTPVLHGHKRHAVRDPKGARPLRCPAMRVQLPRGPT